MNNFIDHELTDAVLQQFAGTPSPRLRHVLSSLVRHLHDFVRENDLTLEEWRAGIDFLTRTGQISDDKRQEFILLSDVLGVSMLVDAMNHRPEGSATESTVLGPFYVEGAPDLGDGSTIANEGTGGEAVLIRGRVTNTEGLPIAGAQLDIWQTSPDGLYDIQEPEKGMNLRGKFLTDGEGRYSFRTARPVSYPIPNDGPVGKLLETTGRHPYRPAHVHFIITADGYEPLTTQLFSGGDPYLESDAVFGVKRSLVVDYQPSPDGGWLVEYDFGLKQA